MHDILNWVNENAPEFADISYILHKNLPHIELVFPKIPINEDEDFAFKIYQVLYKEHNKINTIGVQLTSSALGVIEDHTFIFDKLGELKFHRQYLANINNPRNPFSYIADRNPRRLNAHKKTINHYLKQYQIIGLPEWIENHAFMKVIDLERL